MKNTILISAFACKPGYGSEYEFAYQLVHRISKIYNVFLITESQSAIELQKDSLYQNVQIIPIPISKLGRYLVNKQGAWLFYLFYKIWQVMAFIEAKKLVSNNNSIILSHHLNMIGFREPGYLHKLPLKFHVLGPLGGLGNQSYRYLKGVPGLKHKLGVVLKNILNELSLYSPQVQSAVVSSSQVICAYPEASTILKKKFRANYVEIPETGCSQPTADLGSWSWSDRKYIIWVGKQSSRKQFPLAYKSYRLSDAYGSKP